MAAAWAAARCSFPAESLGPQAGGQGPEMIRPSVSELTREVRSNILCTVKGCGKILPNPPALGMHLVKSHRVKDCSINPTVRKDLKSSVQKLYCCPIEGCPRGPNRPFSEFSRVKQHFMKIHAEKKYKCDKCSNSYGTERDLKRHAEYCGKIFQCTCGCPYASRTALLSHIYRTGHEIPAEHRDPPGKKRKSEELNQNHFTKTAKEQQKTQSVQEPAENNQGFSVESTFGNCGSNQNPTPAKQIQKLLLPKPRVALVKLPVMHFTHLPVFVSSGTPVDSSIKSVVVAVDNQGSVMSTMHVLSTSEGTLIPTLEAKTLNFKDTVPLSKMASVMVVEPVSAAVQVNMDSDHQVLTQFGDLGQKNKCTSMNVQTDISYLAQNPLPESLAECCSPESTVSACAQTDLTFSAQVLLPISVQTQTFGSDPKITTSMSAQTDSFDQSCFPSYGVSRETQTNVMVNSAHVGGPIHQALINTDNPEDMFDHSSSSYAVCRQTQTSFALVAEDLDQRLANTANHALDLQSTDKSLVDFQVQTSLLQQNPMTDNQTQTMSLFNDLENILSESMSGHSLENRGLLSESSHTSGENMASNQVQTAAIDFDIEEFLSATNIQTQTEENELGAMQAVSALESLDIETQTDFLFSDHPGQVDTGRGPNNYLGLEMFDTQTQTDLNFLLDSSSHLPLGSILKQSSFSLSTDSNNTETQTDVHSLVRNNYSAESQVRLNCAETQTTSSCFENLGSLFCTSNETQTVVDDFLLADMAWNPLESHFSSVETQTCDEIFSLFQNTDKSSN
ncbi:ATM interactor [Callorhinchus milii]|uniref:ATM interactor n=1 Tax=Callorhinchus milii TaxID=7868 RepID=A0A4W3IHP5_CALMI|nr:ATM interactor [Callorhinchus milii]|eukprot:gi/632944257/ref/XP_007887411.1/ PREDICTED: ATM interactor [Callorhinchus milii]